MRRGGVFGPAPLRLARLATICFSFCALAACSPSMFWDPGDDFGVLNRQNYRRVNTSCSGLSLSSSTIDVSTFRSLLHCFNSTGALQEVESLFDRLSDDEVGALVNSLNDHFLNDPHLIYQLESTYSSLDSQGYLDPTLVQFGKLLENEEFVSASMGLLRDGYTNSRHNTLRALEKLSTKVSSDNLGDALDDALTLTTSRAYAEAFSRMKGDSPAHRSLRSMTDQVSQYLRTDVRDPHHIAVGKEIIQSFISGDLFRIFDDMFGVDEKGLKSGLGRMSAVLRSQLTGVGNQAPLLDDLTSLFHYLNRPVYCMKQSEAVPNADMFMFTEISRRSTEEIASFIKRDNLLTLAAMGPYCDFPPQLTQYYPSLMKLADQTPIRPSIDMLKAFYKIEYPGPNGTTTHPMAELFKNFLSDTGSDPSQYQGGALPGTPAENTAGIKRLIPIFQELNDRNALDPLLLVANLPRIEDRPQLIDFLKFIMAPIPDADNKSIYEILTDAAAQASPESLYKLAYSFRRYLESDEPVLAPGIRTLRTAFYINDVHPITDFLQGILADATKNEKLFDVVFKMAQLPEFPPTIRLTSDMAKDGRLKELLGAVVTLFHNFAEKGRMPIHPGTEPPFIAKRRHDLISTDLDLFPVDQEPSNANQACQDLNLNVPLDDYHSGKFDTEFNNFVFCLNSHGQHQDIADSLIFLQTQKTDDQRSYFALQVDMMKALAAKLATSDFAYLVNNWIKAYDDGRFSSLLNAIPLAISRALHVPGELPGNPTLLDPAFRLVKPVMSDHGMHARSLLDYSGRLMERSDFPQALGLLDYLKKIEDQGTDPATQPDFTQYDADRIRRWVFNKECSTAGDHPSDGVQFQRSNQIISDYRDAITGWELVNGEPRRGYTTQEFHDALNPIFSKFADPGQSVPERPLSQAISNFMRDFTLEKGQAPNEFQHFHPEDLMNWLRDRSTDYRLVSYFYPGENIRRVRLMNSLDRMDAMLVNADFKAPFPFNKNFALEFLGEVAEAWGDEPRELWPREIREKFPPGKNPKTLDEAFNDILGTEGLFENLVGFPELQDGGNGCPGQIANPNDPEEIQQFETTDTTASGIPLIDLFLGKDALKVKAGIYNNHQVLSVLKENLPGTGNGGLRILRNLLFQIYYSTPPNHRNAKDGDANNLSITLKMVRMGMMREVSRYMRAVDPRDPMVVDLFRTITFGGASPEFVGFLKTAMEDGANQPVIWRVLDELGAMINADEDHDLSPSRQKELEGQSAEAQRRIKYGWRADLRRLKQTSFYALSMAEPLGLIDPFLKAAHLIVHDHAQYLAQTDRFEKLFRSRDFAYLTRGLYESKELEKRNLSFDILRDFLSLPVRASDSVAILKALDKDPMAWAEWDTLSARFDLVKTFPEYGPIKAVADQIFDFFKLTSGDPQALETARKLREYGAERVMSPDLIRKSDVEQILALIESNPDEFYKVMETLSHSVQDGDLKDFFSLVRRSIGH